MMTCSTDPISYSVCADGGARGGNRADGLAPRRQYTTGTGARECRHGTKREAGTGNAVGGSPPPRHSLFLFLLLIAACQTLPAAAPTPSASTTSAATSTPDPALAAQQQRFIAAAAARDADALSALFAEDGVLHVAGRPPVRGQAAVRQFYGAVFSFMSASSMAPERLDMGAGGDMAWGVGATTNEFRGPDGTMRYAGKYLLVWRRVEAGEWRVAAYAISSDEPQGD